MPLDGVHDAAARGFGLQVDEYERSRPGYPVEIVDQLLADLGLGGQDKKVLDLASGTGKFTRHLLRHKELDVLAVDQSPEMVAALKQNLPGVIAREGTATDLPAQNDSLDAVFVAQGFHWFANVPSLREIHRVLKPGGHVSFLWNREDVSVPWIKELLTQLVEPLSSHLPQYWRGIWKQPFQEDAWVKKAFGIKDLDSNSTFHKHSIAITRDQLWGRLLSKSYISLRSQEENVALRQQVDALLDRHGVKFDGPGETHVVPLTLEVFVAQKV